MSEMIVAAFASLSVAQGPPGSRKRPDTFREHQELHQRRAYLPRIQDTSARTSGRLLELFGEEPTQTQEYGAYDTSLASGHTVVTVTVDEVHADAVMGILNQHGPHDIHEQTSGASETYQTGTTAYPATQPTNIEIWK